MPKKFTVNDINQLLIPRKIKCIGSYENNKGSTLWMCEVCEHTWNNSFSNIFHNHQGCPRCAGQTSMSNEEIKQALFNDKRNILILEKPIGNNKKITWLCGECNYKWDATPYKVILEKTGCPRCAGRPSYSDGNIDERVKEVNPLVFRVGTYKSTHEKLEWGCISNHTHSWFATPQAVLGKTKTGCPYCRTGTFGSVTSAFDGEKFRSKRERDSYEILLKYFSKSEIIRQQRYNKSTKHTCDFVIPSHKMWIEVGNIKTASYIKTLEQKRRWVENKNELWIQFDSSLTLEKYFEEHFRPLGI